METIATFWSNLQTLYEQRDVAKTATKDLEKLIHNTSLAQKNFLDFMIKFQILHNSSDKPFTDKYLINKLYDVVEPRLQNFLLNREQVNWPQTIDKFAIFLIESYKKVFPNRGESHIFSSDHLVESTKTDLNAMNVDAALHGKQNKGKGKQANFQEARKKVDNSCEICLKYKKFTCVQFHEMKNCYYLDKNTAFASTSMPGKKTDKEDAPSTKERIAGGKGKQMATKANKLNTLKQLKARQAELEKELAGEENDDDSGAEMVIDSARITDWNDEEKVLSQAPELSTSKLKDEPVKKLEASKKAKYARLSARKMDFLKDM